ncbi:hypothetical protein [Nocardioides nanhaiensis]|uniref:DUF4439 domain-containing protein n=1 Tax=Nocardioides nanhaiensis TaxID=1476871 RepID=A0ABP8W7N5_9ACTN
MPGRARAARRFLPAALALLAVSVAGCGGDPEEEFLGSFRDDAAALAFVVDGTVPAGVEEPETLPSDRPGRIGWILTRPDDGQGISASDLELGLTQALRDDPALADDLLDGVSAAEAPLSESGAERVLVELTVLAPRVLAAVRSQTPEAADLDVEEVLDVLGKAGATTGADAFGFLQRFDDLVAQGLSSDLRPASDLSASRWRDAVAAADQTWIRPAARVRGALVRDLCAGDPDVDTCRAPLDELAEDLDRQVAQVLYDTSPPALLPALLPAPLLADGSREPLNDLNRDAWRVVVEQAGVDVPAAVREAALGQG